MSATRFRYAYQASSFLGLATLRNQEAREGVVTFWGCSKCSRFCHGQATDSGSVEEERERGKEGERVASCKLQVRHGVQQKQLAAGLVVLS